MKDVQSKQDLLIRLVVHDIEVDSESQEGEELTSDDYEFILRDDIKEESGEQLREERAAEADTESLEAAQKPPGGLEGRETKLSIPELNRSTRSSIMAVTDSFWGNEPQCEVSEEQDCPGPDRLRKR